MSTKLIRFESKPQSAWSRARLGALIGFCIGFVFNGCLFGFPYVGGYPSLPAFMLVGSFISDKTMDHAEFYVPVAIANIVIWSVVGFVFAAVRGIIYPDPRIKK